MYFKENKEPTLADSLSSQLVMQANKLLHRGLLKSYVTHTENLSTLRGKLLIQGQMVNDAMCRPQFFCEYDELEYDNMENRIILKSLILCERQTEDSGIRMKVIRLIQQFSSVVSVVTLRMSDIDRVMNSYTRQNARYEKIHNTCKLVWEHYGVSDFLDEHSSSIQPFFVDMNHKFESFVERLFKENHGQDNVHAQRAKHGWDDTEGRGKKIIPDIVLMEGETLKEIIDVKYKPELHEDDLYQIGFYLHEYGGKTQIALEKGFAVLPEYEDDKKIMHNKTSIFTATRSRIEIHEKRINVDKILGIIGDKKKNESERKIELQKQVKELLKENLSRKRRL